MLTGLTFIAHVDLSLILGRFATNVLRRVPSKPHIADVEDALYRWVRSLPEPISLSRSKFNDESHQFPKPYNFECRQVHVLYLVSLILLYRARTVEGPFPIAAVIASSTVAGIFQEFLARDEVQLLGPVFTFHLLAAAIALLSCHKYSEYWAIAQEDLKIIGDAQKELSTKWPSALGSIRTFERMQEVAVTAQERVYGTAETKLTSEQAIFFQDIDTSLCRMWDVLQSADKLSGNPGTRTTNEIMICTQLTIDDATVINGGHSTERAGIYNQGEASFGHMGFGEDLNKENPQLGAIGNWLFWDQMPLSFD